MRRANKRAKATTASSGRHPGPMYHADLARFEHPAEADPVELASAVAIGQFLCVIGRLPEHNDFLERGLAASAGLLVWPADLLAAVDLAIRAGRTRDADSFLLDDEEEAADDDDVDRNGRLHDVAKHWQCLVDPGRTASVRDVLFKVMNADATLRRRLGTATLDWALTGSCPPVPALRNAHYIAEAFRLGEGGHRLVELIILSELNSSFADALNQLDFGKRHEMERFLARFLDCDPRDMSTLLASDGLLARVGVIAGYGEPTTIGDLLATDNAAFSQNLTTEHASREAFLESFLMLSASPRLDDTDTRHLQALKGLAIPLLRSAATLEAQGINLMLYGAPGTGKTEVARQITQMSGLRLYEVRFAGRDGKSLSAQQRLGSLLLTLHALRGVRDAAILLDEAEDILMSCQQSLWGRPFKDNDLSKAWVTRLLEENAIPILWTANHVRPIDAAVLRRFAVIYEFVELPRSVKRRMAQKYLGGLAITDTQLDHIAALPELVPAQLENAARTASLVAPVGADATWQCIRLQLDESRRAMGLLPMIDGTTAPIPYDAQCLNLRGDMTPARLLDGLRTHGRAALCFYGQSGTGKTGLAHHIARELDRELIVHSASDLLSKWVGDTEQRIAEMFHRAAQRAVEVVLLLDEADTFLKDRSTAPANWEQSQTNEFLARMERFPGVFICTTNLYERLDKAVLRRFQFRIEFLGLKAEQAIRLFQAAFGRAPTYAEASALNHLEGRLAPADFANVARQLAFTGKTGGVPEPVTLLADECRSRGAHSAIGRPIGFVRSSN